MNWYYMSGGASGERKGPIPHHHFVAMVQQGKIPQATLASSPELTGGKWLVVKDIPILWKGSEGAGPEAAPPPKVAVPPSQPSENHMPFEDGRPMVHVKSSRSSSVRSVFDHYWMPSYIQAIWQVTLILSGVIFLGAFVFAFFFVLQADLQTGAMLSVGMLLALVAAWLVGWIIAVRLILEMYAIFFDIRSYVKRQTELMEQGAVQ